MLPDVASKRLGRVHILSFTQWVHCGDVLVMAQGGLVIFWFFFGDLALDHGDVMVIKW